MTKTENDSRGNLDDILGGEPVTEEMEAESTESEEIETKSEEKPSKTEEKAKEVEPDKKILVEHGAFHEEREKRKELQKKLADMEAKQSERDKIVEERQTKILEALTRQPVQEEYTDPLARLENEVKELKGGIQKTQQQVDDDNKALNDRRALQNRYLGSIEAFIKDQPDFADARMFLINDKTKELVALDYTKEEIDKEIEVIERQIVERAYNKEVNPAKLVFKLAQEKGYKQKEKEQEKTIEDIDKGLKASKSLGTGGAISNDNDLKGLSAEDLREMSNEEFNALFSKIEKQSKKRS